MLQGPLQVPGIFTGRYGYVKYAIWFLKVLHALTLIAYDVPLFTKRPLGHNARGAYSKLLVLTHFSLALPIFGDPHLPNSVYVGHS